MNVSSDLKLVHPGKRTSELILQFFTIKFGKTFFCLHFSKNILRCSESFKDSERFR